MGVIRRGLKVLGALLLLSGMWMLATGSANAQESMDDPADVEDGKEIFEANCARCHGNDGTGSNFGRDLTDVATQEPDRSVHITSVTDGKGNMPAFGSDLSEDDIDKAISYVRLEFVTEAEAELALTGVETKWGIIASLALIGAGLLLVGATRRPQLGTA